MNGVADSLRHKLWLCGGGLLALQEGGHAQAHTRGELCQTHELQPGAKLSSEQSVEGLPPAQRGSSPSSHLQGVDTVVTALAPTEAGLGLASGVQAGAAVEGVTEKLIACCCLVRAGRAGGCLGAALREGGRAGGRAAECLSGVSRVCIPPAQGTGMGAGGVNVRSWTWQVCSPPGGAKGGGLVG